MNNKASVFQQIIKDSIICDPGGSGIYKITKDDANRGLAVIMSTSPKVTRGFGLVNVEKAASPGDYLFGILGDFHSDGTCSIIRKGRIFVTVADSNTVTDAHIGHQIEAHLGTRDWNIDTRDIGKCRPYNNDHASQGRTGEILSYGTHSRLGKYMVVDINYPYY